LANLVRKHGKHAARVRQKYIGPKKKNNRLHVILYPLDLMQFIPDSCDVRYLIYLRISDYIFPYESDLM